MTSKRRKWVMVAAGVALTLVMIITLRHPGEGPIHMGHHLSEWVDTLGRTAYGIEAAGEDDLEAENAVLDAGTNAGPFLLRWIQHEETGNRWRYAAKLRPWISIRLLRRLGVSSAQCRAAGSVQALQLLSTNLGPDQRTELTRLLNNPAAPQTASRAARVLAVIGPEGAATLATVLPQSRHPARLTVLALLYDLHCQSNLNLPAKTLVPALIDITVDTNSIPPIGVWYASMFLSGLNVTPNQYVPALTNLLSDPDLSVRLMATNALRRIAPEALTNTTAQ